MTEKDTETLIHVTQTHNHAYRQTDRQAYRVGERDRSTERGGGREMRSVERQSSLKLRIVLLVVFAI